MSRVSLPPDVVLPPIILITVDTLRADHLSVYGYARDTSPHLADFARRSTLYSKARSPAAWTLPAHASLFTGLYPSEHGSQMIRRVPDAVPSRDFPLDEAFTTLAEALRSVGYDTAGVAANSLYLTPRYKLDQGFDDWEFLPGEPGVSAARAPEVNARAFAWLAARDPGPFFLFLNYMDTHTPYSNTPRAGFLDGAAPAYTAYGRKLTESAVMASGHATGVPPEGLIRNTVDQYDLAIANLDAGLGALFEELRRLEVFDEALIIVTSDHGEFLGEHDLIGHAKDVYDGVLSIPLLVKAPGQVEAATEGRLVSLVHVPRLLLSAAGLSEFVDPDLFPYRFPEPTAFAENRFSLWVDIEKPWGGRFDRIREALYTDTLKYIHSSDGHHELYDIASDPDETRNLLESNPELGPEWARRIEAVRPKPDARRAGRETQEAEPFTEEELDRLRALGYIN